MRGEGEGEGEGEGGGGVRLGWLPVHRTSPGCMSADPNPNQVHTGQTLPYPTPTPTPTPNQVHIGQTLVLYRAEEYRVLELLKNLALGRVLQYMRAGLGLGLGLTLTLTLTLT